MNNARLKTRRAERSDIAALSRFGVELARLHCSFDSQRFTVAEPQDSMFEEFFAEQIERREAVLLIAEQDGKTVGYAFVRMEPPSLEDLRGSAAWLHDIFVDPTARVQGVGSHLMKASLEAARSLGSDSLMLSVAPQNDRARRLFEQFGFRPTMVEMRVEL